MAHAAIVQTPTLANPATLAAKMEMNPSTSAPSWPRRARGCGLVLHAAIRGRAEAQSVRGPGDKTRESVGDLAVHRFTYAHTQCRSFSSVRNLHV